MMNFGRNEVGDCTEFLKNVMNSVDIQAVNLCSSGSGIYKNYLWGSGLCCPVVVH